jgi:type IV pilus assembly protein PilV
MKTQKQYHHKSSQQGVVLLEALIAILIFSMGILALVGLQANMLQNTSSAKYRADASYLAQQKIGQMWADPANAGTQIVANEDMSALLPNGLRTVSQTTAQAAAGQFSVVVGWTASGETPAISATTAPCFMLAAHCFSTIANIRESGS